MIRKFRSSLTAKIFAITAGLLALACVLTYSVVAYFMPKSYSSDLSAALERRTAELVENLQFVPFDESGDLLLSFIAQNKVSLALVDAAGNNVALPVDSDFGVYVTADPNEAVDVFRESVIQSEDNFSVAVSSADSASTTFAQPVRFAGSEERYTLLVTAELREVNQAVAALGDILPLVLLAILAVSLLGALVYSRYVTRPIVRISGISQKLAELQFSWSCDERRQDEIGVLARSLNGLSERLSAALSELRRANASLQSDIERRRALEEQRIAFFSAASHELKTPITVMRGQLEGMLHRVGAYRDRDKYLARSLAAAEQLETMVQELLTVSRMDASTAPTREHFDLAALLRGQAEAHEALAEARGVTLHADIEGPAPVSGDRALLGKALGCLISNALLYSPAGERARVSLRGKAVSIENTGVHIPEEALPHLFEAFYRVDPSRNRSTGGSGLGLYLVALILDQHGGTYRIENTPEGVRFLLALP